MFSMLTFIGGAKAIVGKNIVTLARIKAVTPNYSVVVIVFTTMHSQEKKKILLKTVFDEAVKI